MGDGHTLQTPAREALVYTMKRCSLIKYFLLNFVWSDLFSLRCQNGIYRRKFRVIQQSPPKREYIKRSNSRHLLQDHKFLF